MYYMGRFIIKKSINKAAQKRHVVFRTDRQDPVKHEDSAKNGNIADSVPSGVIVTAESVNNDIKTENMLTTKEKIEMFGEVNSETEKQAQKTKKIRNDKGLIEKVESTKTVLTEDNRELLRD